MTTGSRGKGQGARALSLEPCVLDLAATDDLPAYVRRWLSAHADMPAQDMGAALDADLRRAFGGRRVYVQRQPKAERLARLAALPPDTPIEAAARAIGVSVGHLYELRKLARD